MCSVAARLDRVQFVSWAKPRQQLPAIPGFVVGWDTFVRSQTTVSTYARCREYVSLVNDTKMYWQYARQKGWLMPWKVTMVGDDKSGLSRDEVERVLKHCHLYRFLTVEIAIDFHPSTGVDREFIRRHGVFGKSKRRA